MTLPSPSYNDKTVQVRRARVGSIDIYEIKDSELEILEKGGPAETQFNFAVFLMTLAFSSIIALSTATFKSDIIQITFVVVAVVGSLGGLYLFIQWKRTKTSVRNLAKDIRNRMNDDQVDVQQEDSQPAASHDEPTPPRS